MRQPVWSGTWAGSSRRRTCQSHPNAWDRHRSSGGHPNTGTRTLRRTRSPGSLCCHHIPPDFTDSLSTISPLTNKRPEGLMVFILVYRGIRNRTGNHPPFMRLRSWSFMRCEQDRNTPPFTIRMFHKKHIILMIRSLPYEIRCECCRGYGREPANLPEDLPCMPELPAEFLWTIPARCTLLCLRNIYGPVKERGGLLLSCLWTLREAQPCHRALLFQRINEFFIILLLIIVTFIAVAYESTRFLPVNSEWKNL